MASSVVQTGIISKEAVELKKMVNYKNPEIDDMTIGELKDVTSKLGSYLFYISYLGSGVVLFVGGYMYNEQVEGASEFVTVSLAVSGAMLVLLGLVGLIAIKQVQWFLLLCTQVCNMVLFVFLLLGAVIGLILGLDIKDPVRESVSQAWKSSEWQKNFYGAAHHHVKLRP